MELKFVEKGMLCHKYTSLIVVDKAFVSGEMEIADSKRPYYIKYSNNYYEKYALKAIWELEREGKAKCLKSWTRGDYIDDPNGRPYKVGGIDCSIWDLREAFGITDPLSNFLDYETNAFLEGRMSCLI